MTIGPKIVTQDELCNTCVKHMLGSLRLIPQPFGTSQPASCSCSESLCELCTLTV